MQIVVVQSKEQGIERAKELLYEKVDRKTVLFLSGGSTPKFLYETLAKEKIIKPAAVGMIDERYGKKWHENSNEKMVKESGLLSYLEKQGTSFYPILKEGLLREETAAEYDKTTRDLFFNFPRSIAVMGVGVDGHTSSIIPNRKDFIDPMFEEGKHHLFVGEFNDNTSSYGERIGMTFAGLSLIDFFIVLVFGKDKKKALDALLASGDLEEIPARFFNQQASKNTLIITDQKV